MRRCVAWFALTVCVLLCTRAGKASPIKGSIVGRPKVEAMEEFSQAIKFKGGQRACVVVMGDHDPVVPITIEIRDAKGKLVARDEPAKNIDDSAAVGNDVGAVIWYPPRDAEYTVTVKNFGDRWNACWIAIR